MTEVAAIRPNRTAHLLQMDFMRMLIPAIESCAQMEPNIAIFEAWRSPTRQDYLYAQGRTRPGQIVTNAAAWQSWHQYGLAVDLAVNREGVWSWDFDADLVAQKMKAFGIESGPKYEKCHFQVTCGLTIKEAQAINAKAGVLAVWDEISRRLKI